MLAIFRRYAFPGARRWQNAREMRSPASDGGNILARCVLGGLAVARFRRGAFLGVNPWQVLRSMHPKNGLGRKNRQFVARFARHASEMSWLRQDMRAVHPKSPANSRLGMHRANILPGRGPFRCAGPSDHARRADLATPRQRRTAPGHQADASRRSSSDARGARRTRGGVFQLMLQEQLRFPATQENVEARRALAVVHWTKPACHQHFIDAESTAIFEHDNTRLKAAIPPEPCQHVHRFAVHAPHFAIFRPAVHVCILEQVFV